jgi:ribosome silencing factor RsfS/YbeB/iojap
MDISSWDKALLLTRAALEKKACDLVVLDVHEHTSIADYFIVCSGRSDRQVQSIAQGLEDDAAEKGIKPFAVEGAQRGHWVLMTSPTSSCTSSTSQCASSTISMACGATRRVRNYPTRMLN